MFAAALIVAGIALVDSLNPGTLAPALVLAASAKPVRRILEFTAGVFVVNMAGGVLLVLGPGNWLLDQIPSPSDDLKRVLLIAGGCALLAGAGFLVAAHKRLTRPKPPKEGDDAQPRRTGPAFIFGAGLALAELPTAFPYFAAIAAIDAADLSAVAAVALLVLFNLIFLSPVLGIAALIAFFPDTWQRFIDPVRNWMSAHWPQVLAVIMGVGGAALLVAGLST